MKKKIFTLLMGVVLAFSGVSSLSAQNEGLWARAGLGIGGAVTQLNDDANSFYHLKADSVIFLKSDKTDYEGFGVNAKTLQDSLVLYLGQEQTVNGEPFRDLFIAPLNRARYLNTAAFKAGKDSKAGESAAALWCTTVYNDGYGATYQFTNKAYPDELLNLDLDGFSEGDEKKGWKRTGTDADGVPQLLTKDSIQLGGYHYQWGFSNDYKNGSLKAHRPLYLKLDTDNDSVAVLVLVAKPSEPNALKEWAQWATGKTANYSLGVKIASLRDVENHAVEGLLLFTLHKAEPFVLSANDFNTSLGTYKTTDSNKSNLLRFEDDENLTGSLKGNNFSDKTLTAVKASGTGHYLRPHYDKDDGFVKIDEKNNPVTTPEAGKVWVDTTEYTGAHLDSLGYLFFKESNASNAKYLRVLYEQWGSGGDQFLQIGYANLTQGIELGQYAFRLVYDPTDNNVLINAFQAAYLPYKYSSIVDAWKLDEKYKLSLTASKNDSIVQARLTYVADTLALENPLNNPWSEFNGDDSLKYLLTPLLTSWDSSKDDHAIASEYKRYQRLYVGSQSLLDGNVVTLESYPSTRIYYPNLYQDCSASKPGPGVVDRVSVESDLYLIRNSSNYYLTVPLNTSSDSAIWIKLDDGIDPAYLPSFQWIVKKTVSVDADQTSKDRSPINIINREFPHAKFEKIQLRNVASQTFPGLGTITPKSGTWAGKSASYGDATFLAITDKLARTEPSLGYRHLPVDEIVTRSYQLEITQGFGQELYLTRDGALISATADASRAVSFKFDTLMTNGAGSSYKVHGYNTATKKERIAAGYADDVIDIVALKRQPYRIYVSSGVGTLGCVSSSEILAFNDEEEYAARAYSDLHNTNSDFGHPVFYLRDVQTDVTGDPYFALVQAVDTSVNNTPNNIEVDELQGYLGKKLPGTQVSTILNDKLKWADPTNKKASYLLNPGLFIAQLDEYSTHLTAVFRPNANALPSTFRLSSTAGRTYRRLNTQFEGLTAAEAAAGIDRPVTVRIHHANSSVSLFENRAEYNYANQSAYTNPAINFLGELNLGMYSSAGDSARATLYIDTAYVNRGNQIKPQYLIATDHKDIPSVMVCDVVTGAQTDKLSGFSAARYLINLRDSALSKPTDQTYLWNNGRVRLAFFDAVHANDSLYLLEGTNVNLPRVDANGNVIGFNRSEISDDPAVVDDLIAKSVYRKNQYGELFLDISKLNLLGVKGLPLGNNKHKPYVFSFRLLDPTADEFVIESLPYNIEEEIGPCKGSWIVIHNNVPVVTAESQEIGDAVIAGAIFDISPRSASTSTGLVPVSSDAVKVIGGVGSVSIEGAAGRRVTVTNVLGQSVISKVLSSDFETITLPKGIVLVTVDGGSSLKAIVK